MLRLFESAVFFLNAKGSGNRPSEGFNPCASKIPHLFQWEFLYLAQTALGTGIHMRLDILQLWRHKELQLRAPLPTTPFHFMSIKGKMPEFGLARHELSTF
jgi:hypothetical protein